MDRVFLDANVLFSAAYAPESRLRDLWGIDEAELFTSELALLEARRNLLLHVPSRAAALDELASAVTVLASVTAGPVLPDDVDLPEADATVLAAAIHAGCTHFLTGDKRHFGEWYGRTAGGVLSLTPGRYLSRR